MGRNRVQIILEVDDKGTAVIKQFSGQSAQQLRQMEAESRSFGDKLKAHWMGITAAVTAAIYGVGKVIKGLTDAYSVQEDAEKKLKTAMESTGFYTRKNYEEFKIYAAEIQKVTRFGDEATIKAMAMLQTFKLSPDVMKQATKATLDLAAATGQDLQSAAILMGKAAVGEIGTLKRYGIIVEEADFKSRGFAAVLDEVNTEFGGQAQAEAETYAGKVAQLGNAWGDFKEILGEELIPTLTVVIKYAKEAVDWMSKLFGGVELEEQLANLKQYREEVLNGMSTTGDALADFAVDRKKAIQDIDEEIAQIELQIAKRHTQDIVEEEKYRLNRLADERKTALAKQIKIETEAAKENKKARELGFDTQAELDLFQFRMKNMKKDHDLWAANMDAEVAITDEGYQTLEEIESDYADKRAQSSKGFFDNFSDQMKTWSTSYTDTVQDMANTFIQAENTKQAVSDFTARFVASRTGMMATWAYEQAIEKTIALIGALIGEGAAGAGAEGSRWGGVWGALGEIGLYLSLGVGSMLAGRTLAKQFKATGGWIGQHPNGGWIQQGSGIRDDVFLGMTPGVAHWGMGGEFVMNPKASMSWGPMLEWMNRNYDGGGLVYSGRQDDYITWQGKKIPWTRAADSLAIGGFMSFVHGIPKGLVGAIIELAQYFGMAVPSMFTGKLLSDQFSAQGGWINEQYGWGGVIKKISKPWKSFKGYKDLLEPWGPVGDLLTSLPGTPRFVTYMQDPEQFYKDVILDMIRAPLEQVSKDLVTPGKYYSNPLDELSTNLKNLKEFAKSSWEMLMPQFHQGIDYVPRTGVYRLQEGERVTDRQTNLSGSRPVLIQNLVSIQNFNGSQTEIENLAKTIERKLRNLGNIKFGVAGIDI